MLTLVSGFIIGPLSIFVALVLWLCKRRESPFVNVHGREAFLFQLFLFSYFLAYFISVFILFGPDFPIFFSIAIASFIIDPTSLFSFAGVSVLLLMLVPFLFMLVWFIFPIVAAVKAGNGESYYYPLTFRSLRKRLIKDAL